MATAFLAEPKENKDKQVLVDEYEELEFQMLRMQQNMKEISRHYRILAIDQTKNEDWVIVYTADDGESCRLMAHSCKEPFRGHWEFSIHASYYRDELHIDDIRGEADRGFGSVCMDHLKEYTSRQNIPFMTGSISKRDWDHTDRLSHFYRKHGFDVVLDDKNQTGSIFFENK